jgi:transcriptional regulator with XRE-family HTH domain
MSAVDLLAEKIQDAPLRLIAARIKRSRREAPLTLDALGELIGTSRQHLIRLEAGKHRPRAEMLTKIAEATGRSVDWFLDPEVDPSPFPDGDGPENGDGGRADRGAPGAPAREDLAA